MIRDVRTVSIHPDDDQTRWSLADTEAYRCPRCELLITASFHGCTVEDEPYLACGRCWLTAGKRVQLRLVTGPESPNG